MSRSVSREYSDGSKTRNESTLSSFAPFNRLPHVSREFERKVFNRKDTHFVTMTMLAYGFLLLETLRNKKNF